MASALTCEVRGDAVNEVAAPTGGAGRGIIEVLGSSKEWTEPVVTIALALPTAARRLCVPLCRGLGGTAAGRVLDFSSVSSNAPSAPGAWVVLVSFAVRPPP